MPEPKYPNKLAEARARADMTQQQVADAIGVTLTGYQNYEYGKRDLRSETLRALSKVLHCSATYLLGMDESDRIMPAVGAKTRYIPISGRIAAGDAREAIEQTDRFYPIPEGVFGDEDDLSILENSGNSMNKYFSDGTLLLVRRDVEIKNGDIAAVFVNGDDATVKRVYFDGDKIVLHPESYDPDYRDRVISKTDPDAPAVRFFGKVISYFAPLDWRP